MEQVSYTFKAQDKHNAKRFLTKTCKLDVSILDQYLTQHDGAWGVWLDAAKQPVMSATVVAAAQAVADTAVAQATTAVEAANALAEENDVAPSLAASAFGAFALGQLTGTATTDTGRSTGTKSNSTGLKIEKNRTEQNGVTRPSTGTVCDNVWNLCDHMTKALGKTVGLSALVDAAKLQNINQFTARTQYARWRAFMGLKGRLEK